MRLVGTLEKLANELQPKTLIVAGGVACNLALPRLPPKKRERARPTGIFSFKTSFDDNAAMIAAAGYRQLVQNDYANLDMTADVTMRLQKTWKMKKRRYSRAR